jgi:hypothetical protein
MNTANLPSRLHEFYPVDIPPFGMPVEGEEDYDSLDAVSDRIIKKLSLVSVDFRKELFVYLKKFYKELHETFFSFSGRCDCKFAPKFEQQKLSILELSNRQLLRLILRSADTYENRPHRHSVIHR